MKKNFRDTEVWKWIRTLIEIGFIVLFVLALIWICHAPALSEENNSCAYVICTPGDRVNIRVHPSKHSDTEGWLEPGDRVLTDGRRKNGYVHCIDLSNESAEGWVHSGFLVGDRPEFIDHDAYVCSYGRLAVRKYVGGRRTRWLKPMTTVHIYYRSSEWCVTNYGYIMTEYLELEGDGR